MNNYHLLIFSSENPFLLAYIFIGDDLVVFYFSNALNITILVQICIEF